MGRRNNVGDGKGSFCGIILKNHSTDPLWIPPKFKKLIRGEALEGVTLKRPSGEQWHVKPFKDGGNIYLGEGWDKFVTDNNLGNDEFLIFNYDGDTCFQVQIFGRNGCERIDVISTTKRQEGESDVHKCTRKKKESSKLKTQTEKGKTKITDLPLPVPFTSEFPHFWVQMGVNHVERVFMLKIPSSFSNTYLPQAKTEIILQNPEGNSWKVNCIFIFSRTSNVFAGGWCPFARENKLKTGDICIFELVAPNKMQVHIFR